MDTSEVLRSKSYTTGSPKLNKGRGCQEHFSYLGGIIHHLLNMEIERTVKLKFISQVTPS